jgi:hypothetical protein
MEDALIGTDKSNRNGGRRIGMEDDGVNKLQHGHGGGMA